MSTATVNGEQTKPKKNVVSKNYRSGVIDGLVEVLADSYLLHVKTQNYYWNIKGELANNVTQLFENQQQDIAQAIDQIAKRIKGLGFSVPATFIEFKDYTSIKETTDSPNGLTMVKNLARDNETLVKTICKALEPAHESDDSRTINLLAERMKKHADHVIDLRNQL